MGMAAADGVGGVLHHLVEPLGFAGGDDELGVGGQGVDQQLVFARGGAAGDDDGLGRVDPEGPGEFFCFGFVVGVVDVGGGVPLHGVEGLHALGGGAHGDEAFGVGVGLGADGGEAGEAFLQQRADLEVPLEAAFGEAAVDDGDGDLPLVANLQEVGPEFELDQGDGVGGDGLQEALTAGLKS